MAETTRSLTDLFGILGSRRDSDAAPAADASVANVAEAAYPTKALHKFIASLQSIDNPLLLDLGPVVGSNVTFFGEQLGCRLRVEDIAKDIDRHVKDGTLDQLPDFFAKRFTQAPGTVDGVLCWDVLDYLDKASAQVVARQMMRILKPGGAVFGFFANAPSTEKEYTRYLIVDDKTLKHRTAPGSRARQQVYANRDITRLFEGLTVSDSFLLLTKTREMVFRKPEQKAADTPSAEAAPEKAAPKSAKPGAKPGA